MHVHYLDPLKEFYRKFTCSCLLGPYFALKEPIKSNSALFQAKFVLLHSGVIEPHLIVADACTRYCRLDEYKTLPGSLIESHFSLNNLHIARNLLQKFISLHLDSPVTHSPD